MNVSQFELGVLEERSQQGLPALGPLKRLSYGPSQIRDVVRQEVRQIPVFGLCPDLFVRIELRRIRRQPFDLQPTREPFQEPTGRRAMDLPTVQNQDKSPWQMAQHLGHERFNIGSADIVPMKGEVQ